MPQTSPTASTLVDRAVIRLSGEGVRDFLQGLVTQDVAGDLPVWAGLLTPQGKCLFDFIVWADGDDLLLDCEASSGAFAVHEVARDLGVFCLHSISETSSLTADPKLRIPNAFRSSRQGIHDSIVGGAYAAEVAGHGFFDSYRIVHCDGDWRHGFNQRCSQPC